MANRFLPFAVAVFCLLTAANAFSQQPPVQIAVPQQGISQVRQAQQKSGVPQTVVLPKILVAGEKATLAVVDAAGRLVPAVDLELSTGAKISTDDTGRATFQAPAQPGIFTARITETAQDFTAAVLAIPQNSSATREPIYPQLIDLQERFDILGTGFSGEAYLDSVALGNLPALVLAASPASLVAQPNPRTGLGQSELAAGLKITQFSVQPVTVTSLEVIAPDAPLSPGETSEFAVRADGTAERLLLEVRSLTPAVVDLARGDTEYWSTTGGNANMAKGKVHVVKAGSYSLNVRLAIVAAPNIEIAREQLLAARQLANAQWQKALDHLMLQMEHIRGNPREADAQHAAHFRQEIGRLLRNQPQDPMGGLLRMAWQSLSVESD